MSDNRILIITNKFRLARKSQGLTLGQAGELMGVYKTQLSRLELAQQVPGIDTLLRYADALDLNINFELTPKKR